MFQSIIYSLIQLDCEAFAITSLSGVCHSDRINSTNTNQVCFETKDSEHNQSTLLQSEE